MARTMNQRAQGEQLDVRRSYWPPTLRVVRVFLRGELVVHDLNVPSDAIGLRLIAAVPFGNAIFGSGLVHGLARFHLIFRPRKKIRPERPISANLGCTRSWPR